MSLPLRRVTSRHNPLVARMRELARARRDATHAVLEGTRLIGEALSAGWPIDAIAVTEAVLETAEGRALMERVPSGADRVVVSGPVMDALSPVRSASGAVAMARVIERRLDEAFDTPAGLIVAAADVQDPGNLGAVVRVAEAAGAAGVAACGRTAWPFGWKVLRGAMGSAFRLPVVADLSLTDVIATARRSGWQVAASALRGVAPDRVPLDRGTLLIVGSEAAGLPAEVIGTADVVLSVPMTPPVESLNVAVATGIILYEARRQKAREGPELL
jgi:TrmH family RNA methyltransferase